ncbi:MAG: hypothetical protein CM1200mP14_04040 [Gammaproteobacteria bacterium]|nr:MAG: hypothetical protein CM1200mP14_04040 [Gammaproteobacteria bacterium]
MNSQTRFVLAITLMFLVMLTTNVLFPPVIPDAPASPDSASAEGAEVPRTESLLSQFLQFQKSLHLQLQCQKE